MKDKILIVDDVQTNLKLLEGQLLPLGYDVTLADNGKKALKALKNNNFSLVLLDIVMPDLDGYEVCQRIKNDPENYNIPVIFVTSLKEHEAKLKCIEYGWDDFLMKPVNKLELIARTKSLINKKKAQDELEFSYKSITEIINAADETLSSYDPLTFDYSKSNDNLLMNILKNYDEDNERKPEYVFLAEKENKYLYGNLFYKKNNSLIKIPERIIIDVSLDISLNAAIICSSKDKCKKIEQISKGHELMYSNYNDYSNRYLGEYQKIFDNKIRANIAPIRNFAAYFSGQLAIIGYNYNKSVDEFDTQVLKGFVIHSGFLKTISEQVKITEEAFLYTIKALARASEANDEDTYSHILRVNEYAKTLAIQLKCPDVFIKNISNYAQMHDVGKIHISREILRKPGRLNHEEYEEMKKHTIYGAKILGESKRLLMAREIAISHHEKYCGDGYPFNLRGGNIPLCGRIVTLADIYDALRVKRYYKPAFSHDEAYKIITTGDKRTCPEDFDPKVLDAFKKCATIFKEIYLNIQDFKK